MYYWPWGFSRSQCKKLFGGKFGFPPKINQIHNLSKELNFGELPSTDALLQISDLFVYNREIKNKVKQKTNSEWVNNAFSG